MREARFKRAAWIMPLFAIVLCWFQTEPALAQLPVQPTLRQRPIVAKPARTLVGNGVRNDAIVLKFHEGTRVRQRTSVFEVDIANLSPRDEQLLNRASLTRQALFSQLAEVQRLLADGTKYNVRPLFRRSEILIGLDKQQGEQATGQELADLTCIIKFASRMPIPGRPSS